MTIEHEILTLSTMTSNGFGWQSTLAGYICTTHDDSSRRIKTEDEYINEILEYAASLNIKDYLDDEGSDRFKQIQEFIQRINQGYSVATLEQLARDDWKMLEEEKLALNF